MTQLPLEAPLRALARNTDPATSRAAAAKLKPGGLMERVLEELRANGPGTAHQLAARLDLQLVTVSPRLRPLCAKGLVTEDGTEGGRTVWKAVAPW